MVHGEQKKSSVVEGLQNSKINIQAADEHFGFLIRYN